VFFFIVFTFLSSTVTSY